MRILVVSPAPAGTRHGNRVTALRWARILRDLGHRVRIRTDLDDSRADLLVALHARKSAKAVARFRKAQPGAPVVLALAGTDLYRDLPRSHLARQTLAVADRLVVLQPHALRRIPARLRERARVIFQSASPPAGLRLEAGRPGKPIGPLTRRQSPKTDRGGQRWLDVCVVGHLRAVKDPFRAARAARALPPDSRIRILHFGAAMTPAMERLARSEQKRNPRYRWLGDRPRARVGRILSRAWLLVHSSYAEGGANAISEALAAGVPVLASRIPGNVGLLGEDYPGYFPAGDTRALARLMRRAETDPTFYGRLVRACRRRAWVADPHRERAAWRKLLDEIAPTRRVPRSSRGARRRHGHKPGREPNAAPSRSSNDLCG
jgi:glycosyltransferase involved in cell wall biosynthesis